MVRILSRRSTKVVIALFVVFQVLYIFKRTYGNTTPPPPTSPSTSEDLKGHSNSFNSYSLNEHNLNLNPSNTMLEMEPRPTSPSTEPKESATDSSPKFVKVDYPPASENGYKKIMKDIKSVVSDLLHIPPGIKGISKGGARYADDDLSNGLFSNGEMNPSSTILSMYSDISEEDVETLKISHAKAMKAIPETFKSNAFTGRGIVMTGGGKYFPPTLTAISWIRKTDQTTPIELFMMDEKEYEPEFCEKVLPSINVECRNLREIYGEELSSKIGSMYALKPLAILASRFDDILFMDSDSLPLTDVNEIFDWEVFQKKGLILNSDYWYRFIHPSYYDIVGIQLGGRARGDENSVSLDQHDRENAVPYLSNESGQIFMKKSTHLRSLLLAVYYNIFGPDIYFTLLMQWSPGMGDKDTFAAAAVVMGEDFYQTKDSPWSLGYFDENHHFHGSAMIQPNPIRAYEIEVEGKSLEKEYFAVHANYIKGNPRRMLSGFDHDVHPELRQHRLMGEAPKELGANAGTDPELRLYTAMRDFTCDWVVKENLMPKDWIGTDAEYICLVLNRHVDWLAETPDRDVRPDSPAWEDILAKEGIHRKSQ